MLRNAWPSTPSAASLLGRTERPENLRLAEAVLEDRPHGKRHENGEGRTAAGPAASSASFQGRWRSLPVTRASAGGPTKIANKSVPGRTEPALRAESATTTAPTKGPPKLWRDARAETRAHRAQA